jgi:hypothetical protein
MDAWLCAHTWLLQRTLANGKYHCAGMLMLISKLVLVCVEAYFLEQLLQKRARGAARWTTPK